MRRPFVSCIMPTANRQKYIPLSVSYFLNQDYQYAELVIIDDGKEPIQPLLPPNDRIKYFYTDPIGTIGKKRNYACKKAIGEVIMHWDDDDWYANDWISRQVDYLINSGADICGIEHTNFYSTEKDTFWVGTAKNRNNPARSSQWMNGATIAYWRKFWEQHPFKDFQQAEDDDFIKNSGAKVFAHDYIDGFVAILHPHNTTTKYFEGSIHKTMKK